MERYSKEEKDMCVKWHIKMWTYIKEHIPEEGYFGLNVSSAISLLRSTFIIINEKDIKKDLPSTMINPHFNGDYFAVEANCFICHGSEECCKCLVDWSKYRCFECTQEFSPYYVLMRHYADFLLSEYGVRDSVIELCDEIINLDMIEY